MLPESGTRDESEVVFAEPWEAQAFGIAVELSRRGHFTWKEWTAVLAEEIHKAGQSGHVDDGSRYYQYWLSALERLLIEKKMMDATALVDRKEAWADAYRHTPHGKPVELRRASE